MEKELEQAIKDGNLEFVSDYLTRKIPNPNNYCPFYVVEALEIAKSHHKENICEYLFKHFSSCMYLDAISECDNIAKYCIDNEKARQEQKLEPYITLNDHEKAIRMAIYERNQSIVNYIFEKFPELEDKLKHVLRDFALRSFNCIRNYYGIHDDDIPHYRMIEFFLNHSEFKY